MGEIFSTFTIKYGISNRNLKSKVQETWAAIPAIKFTSCVTLGNLLNLSVLLHPHL